MPASSRRTATRHGWRPSLRSRPHRRHPPDHDVAPGAAHDARAASGAAGDAAVRRRRPHPPARRPRCAAARRRQRLHADARRRGADRQRSGRRGVSPRGAGLAGLLGRQRLPGVLGARRGDPRAGRIRVRRLQHRIEPQPGPRPRRRGRNPRVARHLGPRAHGHRPVARGVRRARLVRRCGHPGGAALLHVRHERHPRTGGCPLVGAVDRSRPDRGRRPARPGRGRRGRRGQPALGDRVRRRAERPAARGGRCRHRRRRRRPGGRPPRTCPPARRTGERHLGAVRVGELRVEPERRVLCRGGPGRGDRHRGGRGRWPGRSRRPRRAGDGHADPHRPVIGLPGRPRGGGARRVRPRGAFADDELRASWQRTAEVVARTPDPALVVTPAP